MLDFKAVIQKAISAASPERENLKYAKTAMANLKAAITAASEKIKTTTAGIERLRTEISTGASVGKDVSELVSKRARLLGELTTLDDLVADLENESIKNTESNIQKARVTWERAVIPKLAEVRVACQDELDRCFTEAAKIIDQFEKTFREFCKEDQDLAATHFRGELVWRSVQPVINPETGEIVGDWK